MKNARKYIGTTFLLGAVFFACLAYLAGAETAQRWPGSEFHWLGYIFIALGIGIACSGMTAVMLVANETSKKGGDTFEVRRNNGLEAPGKGMEVPEVDR